MKISFPSCILLFLIFCSCFSYFFLCLSHFHSYHSLLAFHRSYTPAAHNYGISGTFNNDRISRVSAGPGWAARLILDEFHASLPLPLGPAPSWQWQGHERACSLAPAHFRPFSVPCANRLAKVRAHKSKSRGYIFPTEVGE